MKRSTKAILLSALVYPGSGQLYLKKYLPAAVLLVAATTALYFLLVPIFALANEVAEKIVTGEVQAGPDMVADVLASTRQASALQSMSTASMVLIGTWLVGVVHAWQAGRKQDGLDNTSTR